MKYYSKKMKPFKEPTQLEVTTQFQIKGCSDPIEPEKFYAYYMSNGWHVGRSKMRNWKAAVAGWLLRSKQYNSNTNNNDKFTEENTRSRMARAYEHFQSKTN